MQQDKKKAPMLNPAEAVLCSEGSGLPIKQPLNKTDKNPTYHVCLISSLKCQIVQFACSAVLGTTSGDKVRRDSAQLRSSVTCGVM